MSACDECKSPRILLPAGLVHETPLEATGKAGAAPPTKARVFDGLNDPRVALE